MKKSGFKQKTYAEKIASVTAKNRLKLSSTPKPKLSIKSKKKKAKKPKLATISQLKKKLWKLTSDFIRERDNYICFTSGVKVTGSNAHCGHMYPSSVSGVLLRYHPRNLACQSYVENIHHSGNGAEFYQRALNKYGESEMAKLREMKNMTIPGDRYFYTSMIELYKQGDESEIIKFLESFI